jgi:predicted  nucleic acid-binding Zn-ribbon protein
VNMSLLRPCGKCGHVQNHHGGNGCHVAGCLCRAFDFNSVSREEHNRMVREANSRIRQAWKERDEARAALARDSEEGKLHE